MDRTVDIVFSCRVILETAYFIIDVLVSAFIFCKVDKLLCMLILTVTTIINYKDF